MATAKPDRPRTRAKKACLACNGRRVRCNVLEMQPCRNCVAWNLSCELGVSRRGKYPRKKNKPSDTLEASIAREAPESRHLLENSPRYAIETRPPRREDATHRTVFLGESSPLTCMVDEGRRSPEKGYARGIQKGRLHYSISELQGLENAAGDLLGHRRNPLQDRLIRESALVFPSPSLCDVLLQAYFEWFHPCFPILDRLKVQQDYERNKISPLLLQAMLFIGVSLCSDVALNKTGYNDRYQAKGVFYQRAKETWDVGWEHDTITKLQSIFLMSFWRGGPNEERDVRFWIGAAISLAQKKGMHVMSKLSFLSEQDQRIWKRIWWALYIRDQQTSAALGLPSRIRDEDCEIAELEPFDFEDNEPCTSSTFRKPPAVHISYVMGMAQLARLLRDVVSSQYLPGRSKLDNPSRPMIHQRLGYWEGNLPPELRFGASRQREVMFLAGMLHMAYNNLYILLYRPVFLEAPSEMTNFESNMTLDAATRSTRILEDMLSENLMQHGSVHLITHTFSALCIHTIHFGRVTGTARRLAEHRAKLCLLGLKELQKSWDLENWVLDLFFRCLDDRTARNLRLADGGQAPSRSQLLKGPQSVEEPLSMDANGNTDRADTPYPGDSTPPAAPSGLVMNPVEDSSINMDWYDLFNVEGEEYLGLAGSLTNPDYLNPQNLEFLYRFL